jgi:carbon storage regulator
MLILSRKYGESVIIDGGITVTVLKTKGNVVQLGFDAPKAVSIRRSELQKRMPGLELPEVGAW